ncbi:unnamed protein product [Tenebrio molitor]|nr:unnamed protein product [Tenebrio molitor]
MPNCLPTVNLFEGTVFASRIGIASYSIFNVSCQLVLLQLSIYALKKQNN